MLKLISMNEAEKTAVVELFGVQKTLNTTEIRGQGKDAHITVFGLAVKYPTGTKVWHGQFTYWLESGNINGISAPMDHRARFAPRMSVVGFYEDVKPEYRSQR